MNSATDNKEGARAADPSPAASIINQLRRFHYGEPRAAGETEKPDATILPALLNPYRDASAIRYQYPVYMAPPGQATDETLVRALADHLAESLEAFALGPDSARILRDNLAWLERYLRRKLTGPDPVDAPELFAEASAALGQHLDLKGSNKEALDADLARLGEGFAPGGQLLGYGPRVPLHLMLHAARYRLGPHRVKLRKRILARVRGLTALLAVEKAKAGEGGNGGHGAQFFDTGALSGMLEQRAAGAVSMPAGRRRRIEAALETLRNWEDDPVLLRFVGRLSGEDFPQSPGLTVVDSADPCATARDVFEREAASYAELFAALRIAALELDDNYDPAIHDSWFAGFDWQSFSGEEIQSMSRVVALAPADYLAGEGLPALSHLLGSRLPVQVISWVRAYDNPAVKPGEGPFDAYRFELAYFGIGHRQAVVAQASAARHQDLLSGFLTALDSSRAGLHLVNRGTQTRVQQPILDPWFVASAALESRAHPFVVVNPEAGDRAAQRVAFGGNPQPDHDWPEEELEYQDADGEVTRIPVTFTFADYALLMPDLHEHFRQVPDGFNADELVPVDRYLDRDEAEVERLVPYVWGIDEQGSLARLAVSRALVFACRDRRNYWRTLQELAGVHNVYVQQAIERVIEEQRAAGDEERRRLLAEHEQALEDARTEAADTVMGQLVDVLMGGDLAAVVGRDTAIARMPAPAAPAADAPAAPADEAQAEEQSEPEPEEEISFDEPWLDTAMCTTCDDCMGINKMMFAYNDDKQAYIVDPKAGPYADLVAAAEICPAKCIHPGKPLNPNEPGLEELIARAEPFN